MFNLGEFMSRRKPEAPVDVVGDSLDAFFTEDLPAPKLPIGTDRPPAPRSRSLPVVAALGLVALLGTAAGGFYLARRAEPVSAAPLAAVTIESDPSGAEVSAGGVVKGRTPLTVSVAPGEHTFEIVHTERRKEVRVNARAETAVVHHVQFDLPSRPAENRSPLASAKASSASAVATSGVSAPSGPAAGWLAVTSAIPLTVTEQGQVIGTTASSKIMVPAGRRELRFVNESLGFSEKRTVQVGAGKTATLAISVPRAPISINAVPWAEVWIDGVRAGETPIGNYIVAIGPHEIVLRHPTLGERRQSASVTLNSPARISVDMRKQ